jgi:hypothetical protein
LEVAPSSLPLASSPLPPLVLPLLVLGEDDDDPDPDPPELTPPPSYSLKEL